MEIAGLNKWARSGWLFVLTGSAVLSLISAAAAQQAFAPQAQSTSASESKSAAKVDAREQVPAKKLFGAKKTAAPLKPRAIGFYSRGCLAGGERLEIDGPAWQAMRLSRNRNWGHPKLVGLVRKLAAEAQKLDGWPGLLVGDLSQPRGGPMLTGHRSHQIGLDADIWLTPMPNRRLSRRERERLSATSMLGADKISVSKKYWTMTHVRLIRRAASYSAVERILVHPAIKQALCVGANKLGGDRSWLAKVRPYWGHHYHFHLRIGCPRGSSGCRRQKPTTGDHGCTKELAYWFRLLTQPPKPRPKPPKIKPKRRLPITLARLPADCRTVLDAQPIVPPAPVPARR
jgi:penicillin-insensitive murein endopeptidase